MNRRDFLQTLTALFAVPALIKATGCKTGATINDLWESTAADLESADVLTASAPGEWEGKEGSHVPVLTDNGDGSITLSTPHGMTPASDDADEHYIDVIYVRDQDGVVIGLAAFTASESEAITTITLPEGTTSVVGYSSCNLHGLWATESLSVA